MLKLPEIWTRSEFVVGDDADDADDDNDGDAQEDGSWRVAAGGWQEAGGHLLYIVVPTTPSPKKCEPCNQHNSTNAKLNRMMRKSARPIANT